MSLLDRLRAVLGLNGSEAGDVEEPGAITVEHVPEDAAEDERTSEPETAAEREPAFEHDGDVTEISGIGPRYAERLGETGIETIGELAAADPAAVASETDLSEGRVSAWIEDARELAERE